MRAVRKVSSHFEYLKNRSHGLDVTWQPSEETLPCIHEQSPSLGASQSAVRRCWLSLCTVRSSHSHTSSLSTAILALGKARTWAVGVWQTWVMRCFAKKSLYESCRMGRRFFMMKLICSLGHCECDRHTVHKLSQRRLTADWLAPQESDCLRMHSKVSSDWLPSYIKATQPVLEIFKMAGYFPDSPCILFRNTGNHLQVCIVPHTCKIQREQYVGLQQQELCIVTEILLKNNNSTHCADFSDVLFTRCVKCVGLSFTPSSHYSYVPTALTGWSLQWRRIALYMRQKMNFYVLIR